ncbi:hypothetical protein EVAR_66746_1 [Eumeta japonica]|uniref:115 kDa protein in type-1 retrotransposable element R1DM n=1 Tax=Eumeta variegata TaxID=151549 RepID=A0A4C1Z9B2_EUMVA|nr:hypothetical protein EVAR_66746_1 [Eumeta japonica]
MRLACASEVCLLSEVTAAYVSLSSVTSDTLFSVIVCLTAISAPLRKLPLRISFTVASEYEFLRCVGKMMHSVSIHICLLQQELHKWWPEYEYGSVESSVLLVVDILAAVDRTHMVRSKVATAELLVEAERRNITVALVQKPYIGNAGELRRYPGCRVAQKTTQRRGSVKAAIIILNSGVDVEEDQTLNVKNVAAAIIKAGNCRIGVASVYFERDMPISVWWDSEGDDLRGVDLCDFHNSEGLHILNEGNTPTFESTTRNFGDLLEVNPPFTGAEVRNALKKFHQRKAAGIDGFMSDICKAAIFRDLGLFLAMTNKYFKLGYFPRAWKVAVIKVISKPRQGGFVQYLHRFKLKDSLYCTCDPTKIRDVLHVLEECPMFLLDCVVL